MSDLSTATLEIDLAALLHNFRVLKGIAGRAEVAPVVKADAYGLGMADIAPFLHSHGARTFFVARLDEGISLRRVLRDAPADIYVFDGLRKGQNALFAAHDLRPVLNSLDDYARWINGPSDVVAAVQFDTGMNRLGLRPDEVSQIKSKPNTHRLSLIMSHLACGDQPDHPMNADQLRLFRHHADGFIGTPKSLANSAGTFMGRDYHFDLVRPGISLYGGGPFGEPHPDLRPVAHLSARLLQVRDLRAGESVGYGAHFVAPRDMTIATIGLGYADGFLRALGGRGHVVVKGRRCPILGRISMDVTSIDVTGLAVQAGDTASVFGDTPTLDEQATAAQTISYELLSRLGSRFERTYRRI
ncbi:alanine racemase [Asticcacaulis sp. BYS171W]|uniref:Alanine racemase n=1 Tax=Asticcacaulis aquaticus TaxID=2984212 RepID=A0ABT5HQB8_9CAUL|nr:alanine racemase [Asticcacaulis aquaticus]MDC7682010.1 alanine racemase [Asticcacaulis aquaticus]